MQFNAVYKGGNIPGLCLPKIFLIMRLTTFFLLVLVLQAKANGYAQEKITLSVSNAPLEAVFQDIHEQSGYHFLYSNQVLANAKSISLKVRNASLSLVLKECFKWQPFTYHVVDKTVIIKYTGKPDQDQIASPIVNPPIEIGGKITDENGQPLEGATILVKGTNNGTKSDANGNFAINAEPNSTLVISYVGFESIEIKVGNRSTISVQLKPSIATGEQIVVIGYGTARQKDLTGAVSSVKMEGSPLALLPNLNALEALKGNVSGLNIGPVNSAGGQPSMIIRGQNSISGSNDPLIVLDGVIYMGSISDINPNDIASYDVLKDAVSAAVYGSRSANGVIAITTKKGRSGKPLITFNTTAGVQTWQNKPVMMKGAEWITVVNARNHYAEGTTTWLKAGELANMNAGKETVWLDEVTQTGVIQDYQIAVSGAAKNVNYYLSSSFNDNKGIVVGDQFNRISLFGKVNTKVTSWLELGIDANYSKLDYSGYTANIGEAQMMSPYGVMYRDSLGNLEKYPFAQSAVNPLWGVDDGTRTNMDIRKNFRLNTYAVLSIPWIKGLNYRVNLVSNLDKNQSGHFTYENYYIQEGETADRYNPSTIQGFLSKANGNIDNNTTTSYVFDNILNYKNMFGKHSIDATIVATRDYSLNEEVNSTGSDFASNGNTALGMWGLSKATVQKVGLNSNERSNIGYLGRIIYSFNDKYFLTGSYRRDGASVFGAGRRWGNFAAIGAAWRISDEQFLKSFKPLNNLKFKLSWGQNGNQGLGPYATLSSVLNSGAANARYEFSNQPGIISYGLFQNTLGNSDLGWETTGSWNTGFESAWFKNRLSVDLDIYFSKTIDQIFTREIPVMTGFKTILASLGEIDNTGVEVTIRSVNVKTKVLNWTTSLTYWKNNNKLAHLYGDDKNDDGKEDDDLVNNLFIGKSLGAIYGYEQIGIVQVSDTTYTALTGAAPGSPMYKDLDGVPGITAADRKILGYTKANFRLNMSNTLRYKNFELYMMITGIFGGNHYYLKNNAEAYMSTGAGRFNTNMASKPYWTPENKSNIYPSVYFTGDSRFKGLQSQGYVRFQDITFSYALDSRLIKLAHINAMKVFLSAKNFATFTNWVGGDPETGTTVTENTFPVATTISLGANISF